MTPAALRAELASRATALGFASFGVARFDAAPRTGERLRAWLDAGAHGDMIWMADTARRRASPRALWSEVRSVVMLGTSYAPAVDPLRNAAAPGVGNISVYALGRDYHDVIKGRLKQLGDWLARAGGHDLKVFVDTAPVMEKPLAEAAGLGWQGKHTNLVSRAHGSWLFLASIYTTADLPCDAPHADACGSCDRCQRACPTDAFPAPYRLDARRCISYLTIEHKGQIPVEFRRAIGNRIYGCDDCLAACPWNRFARASADLAFAAVPDRVAPPLAELLRLDDAAFRARFAGSPIKRLGRARFIRNVCIAAGNSGDAALLPALNRLRGDADAVVADAADWAVGEVSAGASVPSPAAQRGAGSPSA